MSAKQVAKVYDKVIDKDFLPQFTGEKFDADQWADLFARSGAKFAGPCAEHHDGFPMYATDKTRWNAAEMGPKRDIYGELTTALREQDESIKILTCFHHFRNVLSRPMRFGKRVSGSS